MFFDVLLSLLGDPFLDTFFGGSFAISLALSGVCGVGVHPYGFRLPFAARIPSTVVLVFCVIYSVRITAVIRVSVTAVTVSVIITAVTIVSVWYTLRLKRRRDATVAHLLRVRFPRFSRSP
jgi:hypothetical protein